MYRVHKSLKSLKVLEFEYCIIKALKILEFLFIPYEPLNL